MLVNNRPIDLRQLLEGAYFHKEFLLGKLSFSHGQSFSNGWPFCNRQSFSHEIIREFTSFGLGWMIILMKDGHFGMGDYFEGVWSFSDGRSFFKVFWAFVCLRYRIKLRIRMNLRFRINLWPKHHMLPCLFGLFRPLFVRWEEKIKMNWPLLDLSASPQVKTVNSRICPCNTGLLHPNEIREFTSFYLRRSRQV